ncbi:MAG: SRPBCC family protein [Ignavibacterium sp.]|nr:MAG: SRPBCC family protein [Ignavibacterium sp.]
MSNNNLAVNTQMGILKPIQDVFEAIIDPEKMSGYFISSGNGHLESGKTITWIWEDYGAKHDIKVQGVEENKYISFKWSASGVETLVELTLEEKGESHTLVKVKEREWPLDEKGVERILGQTQGWVNMLCCLKAYVEHNINLRVGALIK